MTEPWGLDIRIPGDFEHAFLYKGKLLVVDGDNSIWFTLVGGLLDDYVGTSDLSARQLVTGLLHGRSYWELRNLLRKKDLLDDVERVRHLPGVQWTKLPISSKDLARHQILDVTVYYDRLYLSTTGGLFHVDIGSLSDSAPTSSELRAVQRSDAYSFSTTVKYGCAVTSCGTDGLFAWLGEFAELGRESEEVHNPAVRSVRASWMPNGLVNYTSRDHADFLPIEVETVSIPGNIEGIVESRSVLSRLDIQDYQGKPSVLARQNNVQSVTFLFNAGTKFAFVDESNFLTFEDRFFKNGAFGSTIYNNPERTKVHVGQAYNAFPMLPPRDESLERPNYDDIRIGVNADNGVYLADACGIRRIYEQSAVTCKSFPSSRMYRGTVAIVGDEELVLRAPRPLRINRQGGANGVVCQPYEGGE